MAVKIVSTEPWQQQNKRSLARQPKTRLTIAELQAESAKHILENQVQPKVCAYLDSQRLIYSITNAEASYNANQQIVRRVVRGWPDLTVCEDGALHPAFAGKFLGIECKRASGGKLSYDQAEKLQAIADSHGLICIARSVADVIEVRTFGTRESDLLEIAAVLKKGPPILRRKPSTRSKRNKRK